MPISGRSPLTSSNLGQYRRYTFTLTEAQKQALSTTYSDLVVEVKLNVPKIWDWDHANNDIEVYDKRGKHKGSSRVLKKGALRRNRGQRESSLRGV